jgi:UDP-N-acetylglucosamine:LPS N-acetylglucosamine transferase
MDLLKNDIRQSELVANIKKLGRPSAADDIAAEVLKLII